MTTGTNSDVVTHLAHWGQDKNINSQQPNTGLRNVLAPKWFQAILLGDIRVHWYIGGLAQDCSNSLAMELLQSCSKPSIYASQFPVLHIHWHSPIYVGQNYIFVNLRKTFFHHTIYTMYISRVLLMTNLYSDDGLVPLMQEFSTGKMITNIWDAFQKNKHILDICIHWEL